MQRLFVLLSFLATHSLTAALAPHLPIYVAEVFWPPTMKLLVWPAGANWKCEGTPLEDEKMIFSLEGTDGLKINDYWKDAATISKDGKLFAECAITPESIKLGIVDPTGRAEYGGHVTRRWTCYQVGYKKVMVGREIGEDEKGGSGTRSGPNVPYWEQV